MKKNLVFLLILVTVSTNAQDTLSVNRVNEKRLTTLVATGAGLYATSISLLYVAWYKGYPQTSFHFKDDAGEWQLKDKFGHLTTTYQVGNYGYWSLRWAGVSEKKAIWYGGTVGLFYMTTVEFFDGLSSEWGASPTDLAANTVGSAMFISQQLIWHDQRIRAKFSYHPTSYAQYNPSLLGDDNLQRLLKDYNGQTNWFSINIYSFLNNKESKFPRWLDVSLGYGARGMIASYKNPPSGNGVPSFERIPMFFLSADVDLTRIRTDSHFLRFMFKMISFVKVPAPALEFNKQDKFVFHPLFF
ncbi:MAG: DUF2279 domain-containing protein [Bacteroidales bacterium]|nr:DUF2279 domain-containing protein [Bacteroidales bacterium]